MPTDWRTVTTPSWANPGASGTDQFGNARLAPGWQTAAEQRSQYYNDAAPVSPTSVASASALAPVINQQLLGYPAMGIPNYSALMRTQSGNIGELLSPTDFTDVNRQAAERAVGGGFSGSQFGEINRLNMTEQEKIRRQVLGSQMLNQAIGSLPKPITALDLLGRGTGTGTGGALPSYSSPTVIPGGGGAPRAPLVSPGNAPATGILGSAPQTNWLDQILRQYGGQSSMDETPLWQMRSGELPGSVYSPEEAWDLGSDITSPVDTGPSQVDSGTPYEPIYDLWGGNYG